MSNNQIPLPTDMQEPQPLGAPTNQPEGNPLAQYFRHSKLQIELPSQGKFWPEGTLELKEDGLLDVMPLTAKDEIVLKSPEGLLSGSSMVDAIASCMTGIKDPWQMPAIDVDTVLIAIRMASYDHMLDVSSKCSHCGHDNEHQLDMRTLLDNIPKGGIDNIKKIGDLTFEFVPYTYKFINTQNKMQFEQERLAQTLANKENVDDAMRDDYIKRMFTELVLHNTESIAIAIGRISTPQGVVTNKTQITEFINNADRDTIKQIREAIAAMNKKFAIQPSTMKCENCEKEYKTTVEFNQTNFFG